MRILMVILLIVILSSCSTPPAPDYNNFHSHMPTSILVVPPMNTTLDVTASNTYLSIISKPIAERGYYVFPVAVVESYFKENGLSTSEDIHNISPKKLYDIFGVDAIFYVTIEKWGSEYHIISSETTVRASGKLIDARTSKLLWEGSQWAQYKPGSGGGIAGSLVGAIITQITSDAFDRSHNLARQSAFNSIDNETTGFLKGPLLKEKSN